MGRRRAIDQMVHRDVLNWIGSLCYPSVSVLAGKKLPKRSMAIGTDTGFG